MFELTVPFISIRAILKQVRHTLQGQIYLFVRKSFEEECFIANTFNIFEILTLFPKNCTDRRKCTCIFIFYVQLGINNTIYGTVNSILVMVTFFVCRILIFPYMFYAYGQQHKYTWYKVCKANILQKCTMLTIDF